MEDFNSDWAGRLILNGQLHQAGFPFTVIQAEERARYLGALDQGHAVQLLDLQTLVAGAVERSSTRLCVDAFFTFVMAKESFAKAGAGMTRLHS